MNIDGITPVSGWRVWAPGRIGGRTILKSVSRGTVWSPGMPVIAMCDPKYSARDMGIQTTLKQRHLSPHEKCSCGIYATSSLQHLRGQWSHLCSDYYVVGRIAMWGKVVEHRSGWRSEFAYPTAFFVASRPYLSVDALKEFGVPVLPRSELPVDISIVTQNDRCRACGHVRYMHGDDRYGCINCPISYPGFWNTLFVQPKPSCDFVEAA